jgi:hypothetical protein
MIASLEVGSWPIISGSAQNIHRIEFIHLDSVLTRACASSGIWCGASGRSLWGGMSTDGMIGLSWQWAQIAAGVFALTDPMAIDCNLALLASDGSRLSPTATAMVLNRIVGALAWQGEAARAIKQRGRHRIDSLLTTLPSQHAS